MSAKKPAAIKRLEGNPGQYPIAEIGIEALGEPFTPEHLMDDAAGVITVIKTSMPSSVYSALDRFLLSAFAMAWAIHKRAALEISARDFQLLHEVNGNGTLAQSPWISILNKQAVILAALSDRLGLDPKSRAQLRLPTARQKKSKFDGLIGRPTAPVLSSN
jgi:phage terminase small subunit